ncbi:Tyrosine-protein phosphatase domain-containing protein [Plasmodiophora brassicae]
MDSGSESDRDDPGSSAAILPYLYVGDAAFACNTAAWKELGITHAVNCSSDDVELGKNVTSQFAAYTELPIAEAIDEDVSEYFEQAYDAIFKAKTDETRVLVFGEDGRGRAPCIIAAYMMMAGERQHKRLTLSMALKHMESKWASEINGGFLSKLIALEKSLYGEVSIRVPGKGEKHSGGSSRGRGGARGRGSKGKRGK